MRSNHQSITLIVMLVKYPVQGIQREPVNTQFLINLSLPAVLPTVNLQKQKQKFLNKMSHHTVMQMICDGANLFSLSLSSTYASCMLAVCVIPNKHFILDSVTIWKNFTKAGGGVHTAYTAQLSISSAEEAGVC